jgi:hypothetical protein
VAHVGSAVVEPKSMRDVYILLNGCVRDCGIDVQTTHSENVSGCDAKEDAEARKANDMQNDFGVVESLA